MPKKLANIIAYAFHPLLMATFLVIILFFFAPTTLIPVTARSILPMVATVFILTFFIPILSVSMLKVTKSIKSMKLEDRSERILPLLFIGIYYGLTAYLFAYEQRLSDVIVVIFSSIAISIILVALISLKYKISAHAVGAWGAAGFLTALHLKIPDSNLLWPIILSFFAAGVISGSRLELNTHSPGEVNYGALLGFIVSFGSIYLFI